MLEKIIESSKYVVNNAKHVKINEKKVDDFANAITGMKLQHWFSSSPYNMLDLPLETLVNLVLVFEAIDFSFWGNPRWTIETEYGKMDGSAALLYVMVKFVRERNSTDFSNISKDEFKKMLKGNVDIPLFEERYNIVKNISKIVNEKMNGSFYEVVKDINTDIELFDIIISNFESFRDERIYNGERVYFYKLAQLLTSDILHLKELKENSKVDYSHLVGCADYKIPQVMRGLGLLKYDEELSKIVDNQGAIEENSEYELEIRASMIVVIDIIKRRLDDGVCAIKINDYIWGLSKKIKDSLKPYHLTRNTNY